MMPVQTPCRCSKTLALPFAASLRKLKGGKGADRRTPRKLGWGEDDPRTWGGSTGPRVAVSLEENPPVSSRGVQSSWVFRPEIVHSKVLNVAAVSTCQYTQYPKSCTRSRPREHVLVRIAFMLNLCYRVAYSAICLQYWMMSF